jgi:hypothetical protein
MTLILSVLSAGCSIEGSRQRNEPCLQSRECAPGLVCAPDTSSGDNRLRCTDPVDGTVPVVDAPRPNDTGSAPADSGAVE